MDPPAASYSKDTGASNGTSKVGSLGTASTEASKQPIWYRFRTALTTLLVLNAVVVGKSSSFHVVHVLFSREREREIINVHSRLNTISGMGEAHGKY